MEVVIGLVVFLGVLFLAFKILIAILRFLTAPFRAASKPRRPRYTVEVVYSDGRTSSYQPTGKLDSKPAKYWVPQGKSVSIAGRTIGGGMIYVGEKLAAPGSPYSLEAALINPKLNAKSKGACRSEDLPYSPSYDGITPACRGRYLDWLASDRMDPDIDIGLVFLYFYGLERRMIADPASVTVPAEEKRAILAEVERLLSIYGGNHSFHGYATALLEYAAVLMGETPMYASPPPQEGPSWELPTAVRVAIAELARDGKPVPADWAFAWAWFDPENSVKTPAQRCKAEMKALFAMRYRKKFDEGLIVKPNKRSVRLEYRAASPSIYDVPVLDREDLPDVTRLKGPIKKVREVFDECNNDLDAYSRWLGRNPEAKGSLQAIALLPPELVNTEMMGDTANAINDVLAEAMGDKVRVVVGSEAVLRHWPPSTTGKYRKADAVALAQFLEKLGYGIEPDVRFNAPRLDTSDKAVVFRLGIDAPSAPTRDYLASELSLRLAAAVAVADGIVTEDEQRALEQQLSSSSVLRPGDRDRLRAHMEWLLVERPSLTGLKRKLAELKPSTRELLGQTLLVTAAADGVIDPEEIKTIRKLYAQLGLDPESVYSDLHSLAVTDTGPATDPVTVRPEARTKGYAIPKPGDGSRSVHPAARVVLDPALIAAKREESKKAAAVLGAIFAEDEEERESQAATEDVNAIAGLDSPHSAMLLRLAAKDQWAMEEVAVLADEFGLLAEGALETINDAAWEHADSPLFDISDNVVIDKTVLEELLA